MPHLEGVRSGQIEHLWWIGDANSATKQLIFGGNATKFYKIRLKAADNTRMPAFSEDRLASLKNEYALAANKPSNLRYGYVRAA